jgi:uncharacterized protein YqcC (DUF446 family)
MIKAEQVTKIKDLLDSEGSGQAGYELINCMVALPSTPCMDNRGPSAYTDKVTLQDTIKYSVFANIALEIQQRRSDGLYHFSTGNKIETGLWVLRAFDREVHTSEVDAYFFAKLFKSTTDQMIKTIATQDIWQSVCLPWMREILEKNIDLMATPSYAPFIQEGNTFNKHYQGNSAAFLDKRLFSEPTPFVNYNDVPINQGLRALVNASFKLQRDDVLKITGLTTPSRLAQTVTLAKTLSGLHEHGVKVPAYQLDLALTADLLLILNNAAMAVTTEEDRNTLNRAIVDLVDMTVGPAKKKQSLRDNHFRAGYTNKNTMLWLPHIPQAGLCRVLGHRCVALMAGERPVEVSKALSRFTGQVRFDAFQAMDNVLSCVDSSRYAKAYQADAACDYFKLGINIDSESVPAEAEAKLLELLKREDKLIKLVSGLSHEPTKRRLLQENPALKGKVLMDELGL